MTSRRIRVLRIIDRLNIGGPAKHVVWLSAGLKRDEFETLLVTGTVPPGEGDMGYFAREAGLDPVVIPEMSREIGWRDLFVVWKLFGLMLRFRPDIVHTHKAKAGAAGRIAALLYKWLTPSALLLRPRDVRIVHTFHGHTFHSYFSPLRTRIFLGIERALARFAADRIITISEQQRREIHEHFGVGRAGQVDVIALGLDFDDGITSPGGLRADIGVGHNRPLIGIVGRLCEVKNHALFLEAASCLLNDIAIPEAPHFVLIGDGHLRPALEAQADRLALDGNVSFMGFRRDVQELYPELDIVALTSLNEGTPLTLIEGMSAGCAVAATEVGGVVDLLGARKADIGRVTVWEHGVTAPCGDAVAFAEGLKYLIANPTLRREMGARGRAFVRSKLSKERLIGEIEELYRGLLG
jgi:glycosyltransferase involved in cell wall biosynthesis